MKETRHKMPLATAQFHLQDTLEKSKGQGQKPCQEMPALAMGGGGGGGGAEGCRQMGTSRFLEVTRLFFIMTVVMTT